MMFAELAYLYVVFLILALAADLLPFLSTIKNVSILTISSGFTIRATDIEDSKKQDILLRNSLGIFKNSLILIGLIILVLIFGGFLFWISELFKPLNYWVLFDRLLTLPGLLITLLAVLSYFLLRKMYVRFRL
jgi:hypothetical protein